MKKQFEILLEKISYNDNLIEKFVKYLEDNNLIEDFFKKIYYTIEKGEPICKIRYYKDDDGKLYSLYNIKNSDILINKLESYSVYIYDEVKTLCFAGYEINKKVVRNQENSKSYDNLSIKILPLSSFNNLEEINLTQFIKSNPLLFVYTTVIYNIDLNKLDEKNTKGYTYKKEIKNN